MKKLEQADFTKELLLKALTADCKGATDNANLNGILSGFSLGAVVALLFVEHSMLVSAMFVLSIICSLLFVAATVLNIEYADNFRSILIYSDCFESVEELYAIVKHHKNIYIWSSGFCFFGLQFFLGLLGCAGFMHSSVLGVCSSVAAISLSVLIVKISLKTLSSVSFHDW